MAYQKAGGVTCSEERVPQDGEPSRVREREASCWATRVCNVRATLRRSSRRGSGVLAGWLDFSVVAYTTYACNLCQHFYKLYRTLVPKDLPSLFIWILRHGVVQCHLPPTFQSWFTVVNLHVWLLTVRLRALPPPHGTNHVQALIDHFFLDIEDRVRAILQPAVPDSPAPIPISPLGPYTAPSSFYTVASSGKPRSKGRAPERLVGQQLKIFKEQWAGMGMSFDLGLVRGDADLAAAMWRNFLGGRGARGIVYPSSAADGSGQVKPYFRRSVNLVGGEVEKVKKIDERGLEVEEARDDGSGVHDYAPDEADKYVAYPELMAALVAYARRELVRLQKIPDEVIMGPTIAGREAEGVKQMKFGRVREGKLLD
ncbi:hypothetical protein AcV5_003862 [Taiwanofungus camphoratus]|nr:hypothetical protein AcV5_003862 [Antrodia cinnamomea]